MKKLCLIKISKFFIKIFAKIDINHTLTVYVENKLFRNLMKIIGTLNF